MDAKCGTAVQDGDADLEPGDLTLEVSRDEALTQKLETMRIVIDTTPAVIATPFSPDGSAEAF